jgi:type VI secretion system secreted protein Hcp
MAVYLQIPGIKGGATEKNHKGWLKLESVSGGLFRPMTTSVGKATNREAGLPSMHEVTFTKGMDESSIELFGWAAAANASKECKIDIVATGSDDPFVQYTLEEALISSYQFGGHAEGSPSESISLNFTKFKMKFIPAGGDMKAQSPVTKGFDIATGQAF